MAFLITGPSGSGKSALLEHFRESPSHGYSGTDLDDIGYRDVSDTAEDTWYLPIEVVRYWLSHPKARDIYVGLSTNIVDVIKLKGFEGVVVLNPSASAVLRNRKVRDRHRDRNTKEVRDLKAAAAEFRSADEKLVRRLSRTAGSIHPTFVVTFGEMHSVLDLALNVVTSFAEMRRRPVPGVRELMAANL
jgi:energy-coupling factor transporter ATP-binding protein EcfA2